MPNGRFCRNCRRRPTAPFAELCRTCLGNQRVRATFPQPFRLFEKRKFAVTVVSVSVAAQGGFAGDVTPGRD